MFPRQTKSTLTGFAVVPAFGLAMVSGLNVPVLSLSMADAYCIILGFERLGLCQQEF